MPAGWPGCSWQVPEGAEGRQALGQGRHRRQAGIGRQIGKIAAADGGVVLLVQAQLLVNGQVVGQPAALKYVVGGVAKLEAAQKGEHRQGRFGRPKIRQPVAAGQLAVGS